MNILIFSQYFWPESFRINEIAQDLHKAGESVSVLTGKPNYPGGVVFPGYTALGTQSETFSGVTVHRVPLFPRGRGGGLRLFANYISFIFSALLYGPILLRKEKIDIIFVYGISPLIQGLAALPLKFFFKAKLVVWVQDLWPEDLASTGYITSPALLKINEWPIKLLYQLTDRVLIQSESFRAPINRLMPQKELHVLPNPAEREVFAQSSLAALPDALEFMKQGFNVVFAGNIGNNQSVETIVEAADILKDCAGLRILMIGSGSRSEYLQGEVQERNLQNLVVAGRYPTEAMSAIYAQSNALLVSLAKKDNLSRTVPSKVQTYMAAGKPIIASIDGEGARIIRESRAGLICQAEDAHGLAECIKELYAMTETRRNEMGRMGRVYAEEHYHPSKVVQQLMSHFATVLEV